MKRLHREWWLLVCSLTVLHIANICRAVCPPSDLILPCRCSSLEETQIWCSYSNLNSVTGAIQRLGLNLQSPVDEMILEGNNLPSLPGRIFDGLQIARLMLRDNGLERVTSNWLATLEPTLQELYVIESRMRTLPLDVLDHLTNLEAVTLQAGIMKRAPRFARLPRLRYIQIQSPVLTDLSPENFENLPNLEQLHIVGSPLLNRLEAGLLSNLPKLNLIDVSNCSISWLHPKTFINLESVREVSFVWNRISDAGIVGRACRELRNLQILRLDNNFIDRLIEGSFVDLPVLKDLYLSGNMISEIHSGAFRNTPSLKVLDLSKNLLRRVNAAAFFYPSGASLEELYLIDNQLYQVNELKALFSSLPRLRFLDMSKNHLEELPFDILRGHPTLERLHLNENRIVRLPKKAFAGMSSLRELRLRNNSISDFPDGPTWNLPSLKGLDLSQNKLRRLDARLMTYLPSLRRLDLSENFIDTVLPDTFVGNLNLETINLSKNFITSFHALTFSHLPKLYELDASWNRLREIITGLPRDIEYLRLGQNQIFTIPAPPTSLNLPHLRLLDLSGNALQVIQQDTFQLMSRLQWLYLNDNTLQALEKGSLNGLSRLEVLNVRNNRLREVSTDFLKDMKGLKELNLQGNYLEILNSGILSYSPKLETVRLGNNKITEIQTGTFSNARELQELNLTHNYLDRFPEALQGLKMLRTLDLSHNSVRSVQPFLFESLTSLTELWLSNNKLYDLSSNTFKDLQRLEYLDLANNEIESLSARSVSSLPSLIALQLGGNRLTTLQDETFSDLPELQSMDLQSNHLQAISDHAFVNVPHLTLLNLSHNLLLDISKAGVKELRSLEVLDLSDNKVASIDSTNFAGMDWLVELKMDNNIICHIHGAPFNDLPRLRVLSLRHNRMTTVAETTFQKLRSNIAVLDIDGNPLSCSCRMLWLQSWLQETSAAGPRCMDGTLFRDARLSRTDCAHSRVVEPIVPGCEEQAIRGPSFETLPINNSNISSLHSMNLKVPEKPENEYVYDEYVEYEEVNGTDIPPTLVPVDVTAGEMKASPHLVTGDTPTIYAQQKPPKLNLTNAGLGYDDLKKAQQPHSALNSGYSGLSFFGIPLPSLGSMWRGRSTETPYKRGKIQAVNPSGRTKVENFVTPPPPTGDNRQVSNERFPIREQNKQVFNEGFPAGEQNREVGNGRLPTEDQNRQGVNERFPTEGNREMINERFPLYPVSPTNLEGGFMPMLPKTTQPPLSSPLPTFITQKQNPLPQEISLEQESFLQLPSSPSETIPSSTLPREHRTEEEPEKHWESPKIVNPGKIEPVSLNKNGNVEPQELNKQVMAEDFPQINDFPAIETSSNDNDFFPHESNQPRRSEITDGVAVNTLSIENEINAPLPDPKSNMYINSDSNSWYFQNYNSTNLQPFVERSFVSSSSQLCCNFYFIYLAILIVLR